MHKRIKNFILKTLLPMFIIVFLIILFSKDLLHVWNVISTGNMTKIKEMIVSAGIWGPAISIFLMIFQSIIAPLPSFIISGTNGAVFGIFWGIILSWIGGILGALLSFYIARKFSKLAYKYLIKKEALKERVENFSGHYGFKLIVIARLLPFISFDFISYAAGLSKIKLLPFLIATGIGMIPGTIVYTIGGYYVSKFEDISKYALIGIVLIILILIINGVYKKRISRRIPK